MGLYAWGPHGGKYGIHKPNQNTYPMSYIPLVLLAVVSLFWGEIFWCILFGWYLNLFKMKNGVYKLNWFMDFS